jgi:hypothetical protein
MKAATFGLLALQVAGAVLASPSLHLLQRDLDDISRLAEQAYDETEKLVKDHDATVRACQGTCSWDKIRIRREWFASLCPWPRKHS